MLRISTTQIFQNGIDQILSRQTQVQATELKLASGRRVNVPSDDPLAAGQIIRLNSELGRIDQYQKNMNTAEAQLGAEESALGTLINQLHRTRELVIQANSSAASVEDRNTIAVEMNQVIEQMFASVNTRGPTGEYIFSGFQSGVQPFIRTDTGADYRGDSGTRSIEIGSGAAVKTLDSGQDVFMQVPSGNGYFSYSVDSSNTGTLSIGATSGSANIVPDDYEIRFTQLLPDDPVTYEILDGMANSVATGNYESGKAIEFNGHVLTLSGEPHQGDSLAITPSENESVFGQMARILTALENSEDSAAAGAFFMTEMSAGLESIDRALEHLNAVRTDIGARMSRVDVQRSLNDEFSVRVETSLSNLEDLDITQAIAQLNLELTTLEAAQKAYVSVQGLSLFNYL